MVEALVKKANKIFSILRYKSTNFKDILKSGKIDLK